MVVDFSKIDLHETPILTLKNIAGTELQTLGYAKNVSVSLHFNEISELTFELPEFVDGVKTPHYDDVVGMRLIDLAGVGQFKLVNPSESKDGIKTIKSCKAYSLEYEFVEKKISLEEDTYELSDGLAEENTLLGIILEKMPSWRKGTVSQTLIGKYRTFETSAQSLYDFMKSTLQEKFRCVFDFDTYTRTVNIVDVDEFVPTRQVFLSLDNLLKKVDVSENADNIVTCLGVYGADGVDIYSVNPLGTDKIYNLDYLFQSGQIQEPAQPLQDTDDSFGAKWRRWEAQLSASQQKFYSLSVEQSVHTANSLAQSAILLRLDGELTGLEAIKASYVSAIAQGLEKDSSTGSYFSDLMPQIDRQIAAKQVEIVKAKERKALSNQYVQSATDSMKEIQNSCKFETFFTDYVCPICGHVAKAVSDVQLRETWVIKDTAPVDDASQLLQNTTISFTTNNYKGTSIEVYDTGVGVAVLSYGGIGDVAGIEYGLGGTVFDWDNDAYKTLVFDTAPTGALLAWLQKNADKQVTGAVQDDDDTSAQFVRCEHCGTVSAVDKADSELLVLNRYFREDTLTDESFVERTVKANNDNDRSGAVGNTTVKIASATITMTNSDDVHKDTYTISGGTLVLQTVKDGQSVTYTAAKIRSAAIVHNLSDDTYVLSAFLGAGYVETETMTGGNATISGTWGSLSGDLRADPEVKSDNYKVGTAIEISASDNTWYFTTDTSKYESLSISNELYQYGKECLRQMAFPTYTFSIESGNFLSMHECELFKNQLSLGKRIYLDLDDEVLEPICTGASFSFDDLRSLKLEFSDTYSGSDKAMSLAGLLEESVSMGHTVASSKGWWNAYQDSGANSAVRDLMTEALDVAKNKVLSSTMQAISWDESGIRLRKWLDSSKTSYEDTQIWMTDQNIVFTDDNWQTAKMAIGKLSTKKYGDVFGVCAPYLVGTILAGENLAITNRNGNFLIDDEGIKVNGLNFFISSSNIVEPTDSVDSTADLPTSANEGDLCSVGKDTYKYTSGVWKLYIKVVSEKTDLPSSGPEDSQTLYKVQKDGSVWQWNNSRWEEYSLPLSEYIQGSLGEITGKDDDGNAFVKADKISGIIDTIRSQMSSCGGNMLFDKNGLWLIDTSSPSTANKAVWLNQSGIMLSKSRTKSDLSDPSYNSETGKSLTWKTAITPDGIAAEYLTGEYLHAGFEISVGTPSNGTTDYSTCPFYVNSNGYLSCRDASISGAITATSLDVSNATVTGLTVDSLHVTGNFSADRINGGTLNFNNFSVSNLSANNITTGSFTADRVKLGGDMTVYNSLDSDIVGGQIGYTTGAYGGAGIHMRAYKGEVVATENGAKLCYGNNPISANTISVTSGGAQTNCTLSIGGDTTITGSAAPAYDGAGSLGFSDYRWTVLYAQTSTISTSDRAQKKDISYDMEKYDSLFKKLKPVNYKMKDGTSGRTHTGLIAQDIEQALQECGLTGQDLAAFVRAPRDDGGADYGMRYEELIALCIYEIQKLQTKVATLEGKE